MSKPTEVYLIRHAATELNHKGFFQGSSNIPLNDAGNEQAQYLKKRFLDAGTKIDKIYVSRLVRTQQTIAPLAEVLGLEPIVRDGLEEIDGGDMEMRTHTDNVRDYPETMENVMLRPYYVEMPNGETGKAVYERIVPAFLSICQENPGKTVLIVTHGFVLQMLSSFLKGIPPEQTERLICANTGVSRILYQSAGGAGAVVSADASVDAVAATDEVVGGGFGQIQIDYLYDASHLPEKWQVGVENQNTERYKAFRAGKTTPTAGAEI